MYKQSKKKDKPTQPKVSVKIKAKGSSALSLLKRIGRAPNG